MDKFAGGLRATHSHFIYTPHGEPRRSITPAVCAEAPARAERRPDTGLDVIIVRGDKIAALYVFLELHAVVVGALIYIAAAGAGPWAIDRD